MLWKGEKLKISTDIQRTVENLDLYTKELKRALVIGRLVDAREAAHGIQIMGVLLQEYIFVDRV